MKTKTINHLSIARRVILCTVVLYLLVFFLLNASKMSADNVRRLLYDFECVFKDIDVSDVISFDESDNNSFSAFKNGLITLTNRGVSVYNEKNILISSFPADYTNSIIATSGDNILIFERGSMDIFRANSFEIENEITLDESIINAAVDNRGYSSVITDSYGYKGKLTVYNRAFEELYYLSTTAAYPIYTEFMNDDVVVMISVAPEKESCNMVVSMHNFKTGEEVLSFTEKNAFPADVRKNSDGSIDILTADSLYKLTIDKLEKIIDNIGGDIFHYSLGETFAVFSRYSDQSKNISEVTAYNKNGEILFSKEIENLKYTACNSEYIFISSGNIISVVDSGGNTVFEETEDFNIQKIVPAEDGAYLIGTDSAVKIHV